MFPSNSLRVSPAGRKPSQLRKLLPASHMIRCHRCPTPALPCDPCGVLPKQLNHAINQLQPVPQPLVQVAPVEHLAGLDLSAIIQVINKTRSDGGSRKLREQQER
jgi:hypothetical protein